MSRFIDIDVGKDKYFVVCYSKNLDFNLEERDSLPIDFPNGTNVKD